MRVPAHVTAGLYSVFSSAEALEKYNVSDAHVKVVTENVRPNTEGEPGPQMCRGAQLHPDVMAYDFELDE